MKRIGIFGGSFNPPQKGHVEICRHLLSKNLVDQIWVVPCFKHPYDKKLAPFADRVTMCRFAFTEFFGQVKISDAEKVLGGMSYTIKTLEYFKEHYPDNKYFLILGSDTAEEAPYWKDADKISALAKIIAVPRGFGSFIPNVSSTDVREAIKIGRKFSDMVTKEVAVYIVTHGLYE
jgi:nicotinate-nucleotide adenylyltransferase